MARLKRQMPVMFQPRSGRRLGMSQRVQPQRATPQRAVNANPRRKKGK